MSDQPLQDSSGGQNSGATPAARVVLVTGLSGAGKMTALKALEDLSYEAVDNIPLSLLTSVVARGQPQFSGPAFEQALAIGVDIRTRDFAVDAFLQGYDGLVQAGDADVRILYLDCDDEELRRRYEETRHRHPLAADRPLADGIARERRLLSALRDRADLVVDTTGMSPGTLKRNLEGHFSPASGGALVVFVTSFSYRRGLPREADLVFDVRFLANPHYQPDLRGLTGRDPAVADYISADSAFEGFLDGLTSLLSPLLPRYKAEGKSYLTIAVGCTGGRHRSVLVAERLAVWFEGQRQPVQLHHRDLDLGSDPNELRQS